MTSDQDQPSAGALSAEVACYAALSGLVKYFENAAKMEEAAYHKATSEHSAGYCAGKVSAFREAATIARQRQHNATSAAATEPKIP